MKAFNLEKALAGEPVVTRDGRPVKIAGHNYDAEIDCEIVGWIGKDFEAWTRAGTYKVNLDLPSSKDLFMAERPPVKREGWVNVYKTSLGEYCVSGRVHESFLDATGLCINQVATVKIEWEEEAE